MEQNNVENCVLSDIASIVMGQSPPGDTYNDQQYGTLFYQGRAEFGSFFPTPKLYTTSPKRMAKQGDILMSVRAPVGDINMALDDCCIGRGLAAIRSKEGCQGFLHYLVESLKSEFDVYDGAGTVFGSINKDSLNDLKISIPQRTEIIERSSIIDCIDDVIRTNHLENNVLCKIRDTILSKLMSGEIDISNLDLGN